MSYKMDEIKYIVLHHTGANNSFEGLLALAKSRHRGKYVLDYHWFIDLDGEVHKGQPEGYVAPHAGLDQGEYRINNWNALGVAVSGNYEEMTMKAEVFAALVNTLKVLVNKYGIKRENILRHKDLVNTRCPGRYYPYQQILDAVYKKEQTMRWSDEAIDYVERAGIMVGDEGGFRPLDPVTREELAQVIFNLFGPKKKEGK